MTLTINLLPQFLLTEEEKEILDAWYKLESRKITGRYMHVDASEVRGTEVFKEYLNKARSMK